MEKGSLFKNNQSQAVRLPKSVAFPENVERVEIIPVGNGRLLLPEGSSWDAWFDEAPLGDDFMPHRQQPSAQERESL